MSGDVGEPVDFDAVFANDAAEQALRLEARSLQRGGVRNGAEQADSSSVSGPFSDSSPKMQRIEANKSRERALSMSSAQRGSMAEAECRATVLVAFESDPDRAVLSHWAAACGTRVALAPDARQLRQELGGNPWLRLILCSHGRMERVAGRASRRAAERGRFVAVLAVDTMKALLGPPHGLRQTVTEALRSTRLVPVPCEPAEGDSVTPPLEWGPFRIDPAVDRAWVDGQRNDAVRGELYTLLKLLLASPSGSVKWKDVDRALEKVRSPAAHRKMAQRLREALGDRRVLVQTLAGELRLVFSEDPWLRA